MSRIALATSEQYPRLFEEESELPALFRAQGVEAQVVMWSDASVEWSRFDCVVIRSTWDYFERLDAFRRWLELLEHARVPLQNPLGLVRWNMDKRYLRELSASGIPVLQTRYVEKGERLDLASCIREQGWGETILKPTVSGAAWRTHRIAAGQGARFQGELEALLEHSGALLQPFAPEIQSEGEWSLVFVGGVFSHAVLKTPAAADFRVQAQFGGVFQRRSVDPSLAAQAGRIIDLLPERPVYARIDGLRRGGEFLLMEVEAIEPYLYTAGTPGALERYVAAVTAAL